MIESYRKLNSGYDEGIKIDYNEFNNNFDLFYSFLVNKIISYLYSKDQNIIKE